jgi:hypothetical protein
MPPSAKRRRFNARGVANTLVRARLGSYLALIVLPGMMQTRRSSQTKTWTSSTIALRRKRASPSTIGTSAMHLQIVQGVFFRSFKLKRSDFATLREYNDYLERLQDIVFDLAYAASDEEKATAKSKYVDALCACCGADASSWCAAWINLRMSTKLSCKITAPKKCVVLVTLAAGSSLAWCCRRKLPLVTTGKQQALLAPLVLGLPVQALVQTPRAKRRGAFLRLSAAASDSACSVLLQRLQCAALRFTQSGQEAGCEFLFVCVWAAAGLLTACGLAGRRCDQRRAQRAVRIGIV